MPGLSSPLHGPGLGWCCSVLQMLCMCIEQVAGMCNDETASPMQCIALASHVQAYTESQANNIIALEGHLFLVLAWVGVGVGNAMHYTCKSCALHLLQQQAKHMQSSTATFKLCQACLHLFLVLALDGVAVCFK